MAAFRLPSLSRPRIASDLSKPIPMIGFFDASGRPTGLALYGLAMFAGAIAGQVYWSVAVRAAPPAPPRPDARRRTEPHL